MTLRMPPALDPTPKPESGMSVLEAELRAEQAGSLGRTGREVERALARLASVAPDDPERRALLNQAAGAVWRYFIQREACGMRNHARVIADYKIPRAVLARVGVGR